MQQVALKYRLRYRDRADGRLRFSFDNCPVMVDDARVPVIGWMLNQCRCTRQAASAEVERRASPGKSLCSRKEKIYYGRNHFENAIW